MRGHIASVPDVTVLPMPIIVLLQGTWHPMLSHLYTQLS